MSKKTKQKAWNNLFCSKNEGKKFTLCTFKTLLTLVMMLCLSGLLLAQVGTTQPEQPSNYGTPLAGTETNPYLISNLANLRWLSEVSTDWWVNAQTQVHFLQTDDIDATETNLWNDGEGFRPIGHPTSVNEKSFVGIYDGNNFIISNIIISINGYRRYIGFFERIIAGSMISNLVIYNIVIIDESGGSLIRDIGLVVGDSADSSIINCFTMGYIEQPSNSSRIGGIAGSILNSNIESCYSHTIFNEINGWYVGGIVGLSNIGTIQNCFSTGLINILNNEGIIGGIIGCAFSYETAQYSYSTVSMNGNYTGGIAGQTSQNTTLSHNFWDIEATGTTQLAHFDNGTNINNFGLPTIQMKQASTYINNGWDFEDIWGISPDINDGYPYLRSLHNVENEPGVPRNLMAMLVDNSVRLTWSLPTNRSLSSFTVYRNDVIYAEDISTTLYIDNDIANNTLYSYYVVAVYTDTESDPSEPFAIHTMFPVNQLSSTIDGRVVVLNWLAPAGGADGYTITRNGVLLTNTPITTLTFSDMQALPGETFTYSVRAVYSAGMSAPKELTIVAPIYPSPTGLQGEIVSDEVHLEWLAPVDDFPVLDGYMIYRNNVAITGVITGLTYIDDAIQINENYSYYVTAVYSEPYCESVGSNSVEINLEDVDLEPPVGLEAEIGNGHVFLTWHLPGTELRNRNLSGFNVYRNDVLISSDVVEQTFYLDSSAENQTAYSYHITAVYTDPDGESDPSNIATITTRYPAQNLHLTLIGYNVLLVWENPVGGGADGFNIYRNSSLLNTAGLVAGLNFADESTTPAAEYIYAVRAVYDGIESPIISLTVIIPLFSPPRNLTASNDNGMVILSWEEPLEMLEFEVLLGYNVYRNDELLTSDVINDLTFIDYVSESGEYLYKLTAVYELGESASIEILVEINVSDTDIIGSPLITGLKGNYPNPFNPETVIHFELARSGNVNIDILNIKGQKVRTLVNREYAGGNHNVVWNGADDHGHIVSSGLYFYRMTTDEYVGVKRMLLMK